MFERTVFLWIFSIYSRLRKYLSMTVKRCIQIGCNLFLRRIECTGCMIVELLDYRPQKNKEPIPDKPDRTRVVLHPNGETLWADICSLSQKQQSKWTDMDALNVEGKILVSPPLHEYEFYSHLLACNNTSFMPGS
jgi:hypothetical protein